MRRILALSVLACLAASPAFAWGTADHGTGASTGAGVSRGEGVSASGPSPGDSRGENDARGGFGPEGQVVEGMRWDAELGCIEGTLTRCNK